MRGREGRRVGGRMKEVREGSRNRTKRREGKGTETP